MKDLEIKLSQKVFRDEPFGVDRAKKFIQKKVLESLVEIGTGLFDWETEDLPNQPLTVSGTLHVRVSEATYNQIEQR